MIRIAVVRTVLALGCASSLSVLAACSSSGSSSSPTTSASASSTASAAPAAASVDNGPLATARRLALAKPGGTTPVDREVEQRQHTLEIKSESSDAWVLLGRAWVKKARGTSDPGFYLNAKAAADIAVDIAPSNRAATDLIGLVLLNDHKFHEARDLAEKTLAHAPMDFLSLGTLSDANLELGRYDEATTAAQKMMDLKPSLPSYSRVSYLAWLRGDDKAALDSIRGAIDAGQDRTDHEPRCWALVQAAMIFWHRGDAPGAEAGFKSALKECPDYPPALVGQGRDALGRGDFTFARDVLERAFKDSPLAETAWLLGDARGGAGDAKGADDAYAQVVKIGRGSDLRTLGLFWATKDREHDEALKAVETEKKVRDDIYTEDALAWALYRLGRFADAKAASDKARALGTKDARLIFHAGAIRIAAGEKPAGQKLVQEALKLNPHFDVTGAAEAEKLK